MIRYYAYYSCGGYKDMYLGDSSIKSDYTYFLPLLPVWRKAAKPEYADKVKLADGLNLIEIVSRTETFGFPVEVKNLFSHGGYRMIYRTLGNGDTCLAVRDIVNGTKDEENRDTPYTILIVAGGSDVPKLDAFAIRALESPSEVYQTLAALFAYDHNVNGISFAIGCLNREIETAPPLRGDIEHASGKVVFMMLDTIGLKEKALKELDLAPRQVELFADASGNAQGRIPFKAGKAPKPSAPLPSEQKPSPEAPQAEQTSPPSPQCTRSESQESESAESDSILAPLAQTMAGIVRKIDELAREIKNAGVEIEDLRRAVENSRSGSTAEIAGRLDELERNINEIGAQLPALSRRIDNEKFSFRKFIKDKSTLLFSGISLIVGALIGSLIF